MPQRDEIEADLGPVIGSIEPPMQPVRRVRHRHPRWIEDGTSVLIGSIAVLTFAGLMTLFVVLLFLYAASGRALT